MKLSSTHIFNHERLAMLNYDKLKDNLFLLSGPCVIENKDLCLEIADKAKTICESLGITYVFKASFDKANRTSLSSYRGPGIEKGLEILAAIRDEIGVPIVTDVHETCQVEEIAKVADVLQIPAFLCRQTDLLVACGKTGKLVNIKKGQFLAPSSMKAACDKVGTTGNKKILLTERGTTFGYGDLVVDMRSIPKMAKFGFPVIFDATHAVQKPAALGNVSGGERDMVAYLAKAAIAAGADGLFMEIHPDPDKALSDGPNSLNYAQLQNLLPTLLELYQVVRK